MSNGQAHSWISRIELSKDGKKMDFYVYLSGFFPGTPVEMSGYATQDNGAIATFYKVQKMKTPPTGEKGVVVAVRNVPVAGSNGFVKNNPITVVARAADAWITTLSTDDGTQQIDPKVKALSRDHSEAWNSDEINHPSHSAWDLS